MNYNIIKNCHGLFLLIMILVSCDKNDYPVYDTDQTDGIFLPIDENNDSIFYNFGIFEETSSQISVNVRLMGVPKETDRKFAVSLSNEKYANEEKNIYAALPDYFEIPSEVILPKNSVSASIPIKLLRHEDLLTKRAVITLNLEDTEDLVVRGYSEYTILFDDFNVIKPLWWPDYFFGNFTKQKGKLFFKFFWELEEENKLMYDQIIDRWGRKLDQGELGGSNSPLNVYRITFGKYVHTKLYNYSQDHPELNLGIKKPNY